MKNNLNPLEVTPKNIWEYPQNKPSLIIEDFKKIYNVPPESTFKILMARGVCKWLSVRKNLIKIKNKWKKEITNINKEIPLIKNKLNNHNNISKHYYYGYLKGYKKALEECRNDIRKLCKSERWQVPDFDNKIFKLIESRAGQGREEIKREAK